MEVLNLDKLNRKLKLKKKEHFALQIFLARLNEVYTNVKKKHTSEWYKKQRKQIVYFAAEKVLWMCSVTEYIN